MRNWTFAKGHGTANDFVIVADRHARRPLSDDDVRYLCDRRRGIGGDGLLRVVKAAHIPSWSGDPDLWFMDYRNADGSVAEMCGNGARVFVRYLLEEDLVDGDQLSIATRAGLVQARLEADATITVTLGLPRRDEAPLAWGYAGRDYSGYAWDVGNPHLVVQVADAAELAGLDLSLPPVLPPAQFPEGGNVEFVLPQSDDAIRLRVWERGVGETQSCGTGVVAAACDHLARQSREVGEVSVQVPGGRLRVQRQADGLACLNGEAVIVARGEVVLPGEAAGGA